MNDRSKDKEKEKGEKEQVRGNINLRLTAATGGVVFCPFPFFTLVSSSSAEVAVGDVIALPPLVFFQTVQPTDERPSLFQKQRDKLNPLRISKRSSLFNSYT